MTAPHGQGFPPGNENNDDRDSPQRSILARLFNAMPTELRDMVWDGTVLQNEAVDLSLRENHYGVAAAQLRRDYFRLYWRWNTFYLPSSPSFAAVFALSDWCGRICSDRMAAEMTHADTGRHILVEIGIHCHEDDVPLEWDYGPLAMKVDRYSVSNLFRLVQKLGPRAAQVIQITCVFVTRRWVRALPGHPAATTWTDTSAPAPEPIRGWVERMFNGFFDRELYRMVATDQNGDPTPDAMSMVPRWIRRRDMIIYQHSRRGQVWAACKALEDQLYFNIDDYIQDVTDQSKYDILCAAYHNAVQPAP